MTRDQRLRDELNLDPLAFLELVILVEDLVGHEVSLEFVETWHTVGDVIDWVDGTA